MTARRLTIRLRLTLLYGVLVLASGATLLAMMLFLLDRVIANQPIVLDSEFVDRLAASSSSGSRGELTQVQEQLKNEVAASQEQVRADLRARTLDPLVGPSLVVLGVWGIAGFVVGWFVAGRALAPVRTITATARRVSAGRLDTRIGLQGPRDELRELAETFDSMLNRLDHTFTSQQAFVGNASHELRTPVTITRTLLDVAMADPAASPELLTLGSALLEVNARQSRVIEGLLALASSGNAVTEPEPVDLGAVVDTVVRRRRGEAERAGVGVEVRRPGGDAGSGPLVPGDPVLLERLVENLVENGIRYNRPDGAWVRLELDEEASRAVLRVVNTGPVVPGETASRLFEPFRRAVDRVGAVRGTGLGLSIVRTVAQAHHGSVRAAANTDGGLTVTVELPLTWSDAGRGGVA